MRRRRLPSRGLAAGLGFVLLLPAGARAAPPWDLLAATRDRLTEGPQIADFTQTFVPAGFAAGETETGTVALALPDLLRWDYRDPFPRTFLVQGDTVFTWNAGETTGRRFPLAGEDAQHLELLRLDVERLRRRYEAATTGDGAAGVEVRLTPPAGDERLVEVTLTLRRPDLLPVGLAYRDIEGNATRFSFAEFRPLDGADVFLPPPAIEWLAP